MGYYCTRFHGACDDCGECGKRVSRRECCSVCGERFGIREVENGLCDGCRVAIEDKLLQFVGALSAAELEYIDSALDGRWIADWYQDIIEKRTEASMACLRRHGKARYVYAG